MLAFFQPAVGWRHVVLHEPDTKTMTNLAFLRNARHARCHPLPAMHEQIGNVFAAGRTIGEGRVRPSSRCSPPRETTHPDR